MEGGPARPPGLADAGAKAVCEWLGVSANAAEAVARAGALQPGVIVLDLMLGGRDGLELIAGLLQTAPAARIVIFSALDEKVYALRAFSAGARVTS